MNMTRLILTGDAAAALHLLKAGRADIAIELMPRFIGGPLPPEAELAAMLAPRTTQEPGSHWLYYASGTARKEIGREDLGLIELCERCETVELWFDPDPNHQLQLIWLLDYFHSHPQIVDRLRLRIIDFDLITATPEELRRWKVAKAYVTSNELETASAAWQAYRATTPEACFNLLSKDLSALPLLKPALIDLLKELPSGSTGLGATEMRMLEMIARGYSLTNALFYLRDVRRTYVFNELEHCSLLDGLACGPRPAVTGLDDELRTLGRENVGPRLTAYRRSVLSLTEFGEAIVAHQEDFSRHNPIDRWWGGTRLTNDRLWRWNPMLVAP
jgi:hypothetical protein